MFDTALVNVMEYLALGELESQLSQFHQQEPILYDDIERQTLLQHVLNRVPPVYMLLGEDETPASSLISTSEQDYLATIVRQQVQAHLKTSRSHGIPYAAMMTEMFY